MASTSSNSVVIIVFPLAYLDAQFYVISCLSYCVIKHFSKSISKCGFRVTFTLFLGLNEREIFK